MVFELSLATDHPSTNIIFSVGCLTVMRCCDVVAEDAGTPDAGSLLSRGWALGCPRVVAELGTRGLVLTGLLGGPCIATAQLPAPVSLALAFVATAALVSTAVAVIGVRGAAVAPVVMERHPPRLV
jgi:hypothetical protein